MNEEKQAPKVEEAEPKPAEVGTFAKNQKKLDKIVKTETSKMAGKKASSK